MDGSLLLGALATSAGNSQVEMKQTASSADAAAAAVSSSEAAAISRNSRIPINHSLRYGVGEWEDADGRKDGMTGGGTNNITRAKDGRANGRRGGSFVDGCLANGRRWPAGPTDRPRGLLAVNDDGYYVDWLSITN